MCNRTLSWYSHRNHFAYMHTILLVTHFLIGVAAPPPHLYDSQAQNLSKPQIPFASSKESNPEVDDKPNYYYHKIGRREEGFKHGYSRELEHRYSPLGGLCSQEHLDTAYLREATDASRVSSQLASKIDLYNLRNTSVDFMKFISCGRPKTDPEAEYTCFESSEATSNNYRASLREGVRNMTVRHSHIVPVTPIYGAVYRLIEHMAGSRDVCSARDPTFFGAHLETVKDNWERQHVSFFEKYHHILKNLVQVCDRNHNMYYTSTKFAAEWMRLKKLSLREALVTNCLDRLPSHWTHTKLFEVMRTEASRLNKPGLVPWVDNMETMDLSGEDTLQRMVAMARSELQAIKKADHFLYCKTHLLYEVASRWGPKAGPESLSPQYPEGFSAKSLHLISKAAVGKCGLNFGVELVGVSAPKPEEECRVVMIGLPSHTAPQRAAVTTSFSRLDLHPSTKGSPTERSVRSWAITHHRSSS